MFQSTPPTRAATSFFKCFAVPFAVSIHAAHEGGDKNILDVDNIILAVSIHAAHEGGDFTGYGICFTRVMFQSTPPTRAATASIDSPVGTFDCFNPRRPRGRRLRLAPLRPALKRFQSTPPTRAATLQPSVPVPASMRFQSTPPTRAATARSDERSAHRRSFNPRRPRGRRRAVRIVTWASQMFQSTPPTRAATTHQSWTVRAISAVSIHAAHEGGDSSTMR